MNNRNEQARLQRSSLSLCDRDIMMTLHFLLFHSLFFLFLSSHSGKENDEFRKKVGKESSVNHHFGFLTSSLLCHPHHFHHCHGRAAGIVAALQPGCKEMEKE